MLSLTPSKENTSLKKKLKWIVGLDLKLSICSDHGRQTRHWRRVGLLLLHQSFDLVGVTWTHLVSLSTNVKIASCCLSVLGRPIMKSILIDSHGFTGIGIGWRRPVRILAHLFCWQESHVWNEVFYWSAHTRPVKVSAEAPKGSVSARVASWKAIMVFLEYFETYRTLRNTQARRRRVDQVQSFVLLVPEILISERIVITNRAMTVDDIREFQVVCITIFHLFPFIGMQV